eukprot:CAMPEP_0204486758 /NCGR_PEP_ID=MMETSP0471-20130131/65021_1 /ASSEMBLY_ACC=CAM_ASM_000602 /TAXON_ID=2969 /ORGANISM="Oxyrrhis marina" /LENGTH=110 /DNA_ID=CAMNT_0051490387 /DNA_START=47 /DNA_END=375 /DNA_ORIENTATION=-
MPGTTTFEYSVRRALNARPAPGKAAQDDGNVFVLGTILERNEVLLDDHHNPQWNSGAVASELGLTHYPPYPEATGYAFPALLARFLTGLPDGLFWRTGTVEDALMGILLA